MARFDYFVVLARMRTGSNLLEAALDALDGVHCHGELFNPRFIGGPNRRNALGISEAEREADPMALIRAMCTAPGLNGFRYFDDHDPRVLDRMMADPACAKIVLTRNPVDTYMSLKTARTTGQWKLTDAADRRTARVHFDADEFQAHLAARSAFYARIDAGLQAHGQAAFRLDYGDLSGPGAVNGIAAFLGVDSRLGKLPQWFKRQAVAAPSERVENPADMTAALAAINWIDLGLAPEGEPDRGPAVPAFLAADKAGLLFAPIAGGPVDEVIDWLERVEDGPLSQGFTQKTLRQWMRDRPGHRMFTVLRHPARRAAQALATVSSDPAFADDRTAISQRYGVDFSATPPPLGPFLSFVRANLAGQTSVRVAPIWSSQAAILEGISRFRSPDLILREDDLAASLGHLSDAPFLAATAAPAEVFEPRIQKLARKAYPRDHVLYGFGDLTIRAGTSGA